MQLNEHCQKQNAFKSVLYRCCKLFLAFSRVHIWTCVEHIDLVKWMGMCYKVWLRYPARGCVLLYGVCHLTITTILLEHFIYEWHLFITSPGRVTPCSWATDLNTGIWELCKNNRQGSNWNRCGAVHLHRSESWNITIKCHYQSISIQQHNLAVEIPICCCQMVLKPCCWCFWWSSEQHCTHLVCYQFA